jgi:LysR family transcriptional activator of dmlA
VNNSWNLLHLTVFCTVVRRSSFVATATELGLSPAYVSKLVGELEKALGVKLLHRTTRRVHISEDGETVYAWARKMLDAAEGLEQELSATHGRPTGPLRVSTSLRMGRNHVSPILGLMQDAFPGLEPWLELVDRRVDVLEEGFDIDIRMGDVTEPHLLAHPVVSNVRVLCAAPGYLDRHGSPRSLADLAAHDCLLYRERHQSFGVWRMNGPEGVESVKVTGSIGSNHSDIVLNWGLEGRGIMLLAVWDIAERLKDGSLVRVLPTYHQPADVWAVTAQRPSASAKLRQCLDFLVGELRHGCYALDTSLA